MSNFIGKNVRRKEDHRLLSGNGEFVADIKMADSHEAAFLRSTHAHAKIKKIDTTQAKELEGVAAVLTGNDIKGLIEPFKFFKEFGETPPNAEEINLMTQVASKELLASEKVLYVGHPIAVVVAENRYVAEDALELIEVDYEPLPAVVNPEKAVENDSPLVHENIKNNVHTSFEVVVGDFQKAASEADQVLQTEIKFPRIHCNPLETRGILSNYNRRRDELTVYTSTQIPFVVKNYLVSMLGLIEENVRVIAPDVGGGFGPKGGVYPEEILVSYLSIQLNKPVRWVEDRVEHLQATRHSRDQLHKVEVAFNDNGDILGLKDNYILDSGCMNYFNLTCAYNTAAHMRGLFKIPHYEANARIVLTNKTPNVPYRGAGRPEAVFTMDRVLYLVAEKLGMDMVDVIKKNLIRAEEMPYDQGFYYKDGGKVVYDSGNYPEALEKVLEISEYEKYKKVKEEKKDDTKSIGIGISSYVEGTGTGPFEGAVVKLDGSGKIIASAGASPQGQSHETTLAQIVADQFNVDPTDVLIRVGDTGALPHGAGTFASRSAVNAGSALYEASQIMKEKLLRLAADELSDTIDNVTLKDGEVKSKNGKSISFRKLAQLAKPIPLFKAKRNVEPDLEGTYYFFPPTVTYSSSFHVAVVEVDKKTGKFDIIDYSIVHDSGKIINPKIVEGQIQGGIAQGIGQSVYEELVYDENGQLISGTYMDYLLPTSMEIPKVRMDHQEYLSTRNPLGIKGVGEGGAISPPAALANAVSDALSPLTINLNQLPISPSNLRSLILKAEKNEKAKREGAVHEG
ncbi:xanthine dehydrogenase family protein molybdopterin-binding subunit [Alteribacillus iranensis]|uniref:Carbon-monoxide dehydrogenase large subunit n=1 Tax=Alteribacillus iranensis TaxID=930128 RepID=A0A1I2F1A4_9BACI|nr:xanthine dehydrogenase family protein molybdopterin-binding subunit [Alteribacillus iranensis]SFE98773.1 carbon-monoxide dehydrogenase large subunit [Alteribacillus iranensis]